MLFSYTYVSHPLEQLHDWIRRVVVDVWCRRNGGEYSVSLLCTELQEIAAEIDAIDTDKRSIFDDLRDLDALIQALEQPKRDQLAVMFNDSTAVDDLCSGKAGRRPYNYDDLEAWEPVIAEKLKIFFYDLFDEHIKWGPIKKKLGNLKDHVDSFCATNEEGLCPFCGLTDNRDENYKTRDDYDHYLPRHKYPFNSVNFRNLAPMCSDCNKSYKTTKDPISRTPGTRQKAYAPFDPAVTLPKFSVALDSSKIKALSLTDICITITSATHQEEVDTWQWLFGIQERYKGKLCKKRGAYAWLNTVLKESANYGKSPKEVLHIVRSNVTDDPFLDDGYLKLAALEACESAGLIA
jgi:hypothetical protein